MPNSSALTTAESREAHTRHRTRHLSENFWSLWTLWQQDLTILHFSVRALISLKSVNVHWSILEARENDSELFPAAFLHKLWLKQGGKAHSLNSLVFTFLSLHTFQSDPSYNSAHGPSGQCQDCYWAALVPVDSPVLTDRRRWLSLPTTISSLGKHGRLCGHFDLLPGCPH